MLNKSDFNIESAELLINEDYYAPSVHCSYYAVFQMFKYLYASKKGLTYRVLETIMRDDSRSTHQYMIEEFCDLYGQITNDVYKTRILRSKTKDLKQFRIDSDYYDLQIDHTKSSKALQFGQEILNKIKNI